MLHCVLLLHGITMATCDIMALTDDGTATSVDVIHLICILLSHHNSSCHEIMTSYCRDVCQNKGLFKFIFLIIGSSVSFTIENGPPLADLSRIIWIVCQTKMVHSFNDVPLDSMELFPNSSLAGCQAIFMLDMLWFSYCHIECQNLTQMQIRIQMKLILEIGNSWAMF